MIVFADREQLDAYVRGIALLLVEEHEVRTENTLASATANVSTNFAAGIKLTARRLVSQLSDRVKHVPLPVAPTATLPDLL